MDAVEQPRSRAGWVERLPVECRSNAHRSSLALVAPCSRSYEADGETHNQHDRRIGCLTSARTASAAHPRSSPLAARALREPANRHLAAQHCRSVRFVAVSIGPPRDKGRTGSHGPASGLTPLKRGGDSASARAGASAVWQPSGRNSYGWLRCEPGPTNWFGRRAVRPRSSSVAAAAAARAAASCPGASSASSRARAGRAAKA